MTEKALSSVEASASREAVRQNLAVLGRRISAEWAKDSRDRLIFTPQIVVWGNALRESMSRDQVLELTDRVRADVDDLFQGRLASGSIRQDRYYVTEDVEFF